MKYFTFRLNKIITFIKKLQFIILIKFNFNLFGFKKLSFKSILMCELQIIIIKRSTQKDHNSKVR